MIIRFAQKKDVEQILKLCKAHAAFEKAAFDSENKREALTKHLFDSSETIHCLVVAEHSQIFGYATFMKQFSTWQADHYLYLDCLFLRREIRAKGLGAQLMNNIKQFASSKNCSWIEWQTPTFNDKAISFYHKLGAVSKSKERFCWNIK